MCAPQRAHLGLVGVGDVPAVEHDRGPVAGVQPEQGAAERRFARTRIRRRCRSSGPAAGAATRRRPRLSSMAGWRLNRPPPPRWKLTWTSRPSRAAGAFRRRRPCGPCGSAASSILRIVVARAAKTSSTGPVLHDLAIPHHRDAVGKAAHDVEVVADEDDGHAEPLAQFRQQSEYLRLYRDVERGRRFIGDQDVRLVGERHGDHHALSLAAGHLMRIGVDPPLGIEECRPAEAIRPPACGPRHS